jgi:zinc protease
MLQLIDGIMNNGSAGLIDLDLLQAAESAQRDAYRRASPTTIRIIQLSGEPQGRADPRSDVRDLLLGEVAALREGRFDDWLIEAVVNDQAPAAGCAAGARTTLRSAGAMTDAFILKKGLE